MVEDYRLVKSALNNVNDKKKGGRLTNLKITENGGTRIITDLGTMAETLRDFAVKNYGQANHTILGHGERHNLLMDEPIKNPVY